MITHLSSAHRAFAKLPRLELFAVFCVYFAVGSVAVAGSQPRLSAVPDAAGGSATITLSGGTLIRDQGREAFVPLQVTTKSLRDFGTVAPEDGFSLYRNVFGALDNGWAGFTFTITALPETTAVAALSALLVIMFFWPVRRRMIKDFKSIVGLRPPGRVRIEAYRRRANDDGRPRREVWADAPAVPTSVRAAVPALAVYDSHQPESAPAREPMLAA